MVSLLIFFKTGYILLWNSQFFPEKFSFLELNLSTSPSSSFLFLEILWYRGSCSAADQFRLNALRMVRTYTRLPWRCPLEPGVPRLLFSVYVPTVYRMYTWGSFATNSRRERPFAYSRPRVSPWLVERRFVITFRGPFMIHFNPATRSFNNRWHATWMLVY